MSIGGVSLESRRLRRRHDTLCARNCMTVKFREGPPQSRRNAMAEASSELKAPQPSRAQAPSHHETILVLEQDRKIADRLGKALAAKGFRTCAHNSAVDAVRFAALRRPIAVFADLVLASEWQGAFLLQFRVYHPTIPVIVTTASSESADLLTVIRFGVHEKLVKPFKTSQVHEALARAFRGDHMGIEKSMTGISERLREKRLNLGLTQSVVALRSGLSIAQISQIESRASTPSLPSLLRICRALRIPLSEVVSGI